LTNLRETFDKLAQRFRGGGPRGGGGAGWGSGPGTKQAEGGEEITRNPKAGPAKGWGKAAEVAETALGIINLVSVYFQFLDYKHEESIRQEFRDDPGVLMIVDNEGKTYIRGRRDEL